MMCAWDCCNHYSFKMLKTDTIDVLPIRTYCVVFTISYKVSQTACLTVFFLKIGVYYK